MKIAVLIKQVPASNDVAIDPVTHCLIRENTEMAVNPSDLHALTAAIELSRQCGGTVSVFSMGPQEAGKALHTALAMGADEAYLVSDRCFGGGDTLGTAKVLVAALNHTGKYDLVHMAAELLGIPCAADSRRIEMDGNTLTVVRPWKNQKVRVRIGLPCMVTVGLGSNQVILPTIRSQMKANRREIPVLTNAELRLNPEEIGKRGAKSLVTDTYARECSQHHAKMLTGSAAEIAAQIKTLVEEVSK